jgi:hypothetical protein
MSSNLSQMRDLSNNKVYAEYFMQFKESQINK